uniref:Uncharacterized protein n=1 Tax=Romanomermis culicivorax TaxID=13658 RepID=A0A915I5E6_ROMCU
MANEYDYKNARVMHLSVDSRKLQIFRGSIGSAGVFATCFTKDASLSLKLFEPKTILECPLQVQVVLVRFWAKLMDFSPPFRNGNDED